MRGAAAEEEEPRGGKLSCSAIGEPSSGDRSIDVSEEEDAWTLGRLGDVDVVASAEADAVSAHAGGRRPDGSGKAGGACRVRLNLCDASGDGSRMEWNFRVTTSQ